MKKAFAECHRAVLACEDETGRKRCELFRELPDKRVSGMPRHSHSGFALTIDIFVGLPGLLPADHPTHRTLASAETGKCRDV